MTLNMNTEVSTLKHPVIFVVQLSWLKEQLSLKASSSVHFLPLCFHPALKSALVLI